MNVQLPSLSTGKPCSWFHGTPELAAKPIGVGSQGAPGSSNIVSPSKPRNTHGEWVSSIVPRSSHIRLTFLESTQPKTVTSLSRNPCAKCLSHLPPLGSSTWRHGLAMVTAMGCQARCCSASWRDRRQTGTWDGDCAPSGWRTRRRTVHLSASVAKLTAGPPSTLARRGKQNHCFSQQLLWT